ncbi:MAG: hypothetical protein ACR2P3_10805 [Geminicoccaceae bacterium]
MGSIPRIMDLILASFLVTLSANSVFAEEKSPSALEIELRGYGQELKENAFRAALMQSVDWAYLTETLFYDPYLPVFFYPPPPDQDGGEEVLDNYSLEYDEGKALDQLKETPGGEEGFTLDLALVYSYELDVAELAEGIADDLGQQDFVVTIYAAESAEELVEAVKFLAKPTNDIDAIVLKIVRERTD